MSRFAFVTAALLLLAMPDRASENRFLVSLIISCEDEDMRAKIGSFFGRELRDLRDVDVVETFDRHASGRIYVVAVMPKAPNLQGWAMGVTLTATDTNRRGESIQRLVDGGGVNTGSNDDALRAAAVDYVALFDSNVLSKLRQAQRRK